MNWHAAPNHLKATVTWHRIVRTDGAFVREEAFGQTTEFGPMPEEMMLPLIKERETMFNAMAEQWSQPRS